MNQEKHKNINPFPATAVARLKRGGYDLFTIHTPALQELLTEFEDYLNKDQRKGKTICIIGEYGTGKTHLAYELLKVIDKVKGSNLHSFYLDAPSDTFLELYLKRFIVKLKRSLVLERIDDFYCEIVLDDLRGDPIYKEIISKLESKKIKAYEVVLKLGLMESAFQEQLQKSLVKVTENTSFLKALYLIQIPEYEDAVWDWFKGNPPNDSLIEQGVTQSINNDAIALEAIGVFAFLFGQQGHRFILIIDELEKVFSSSNIHFPNESSILAFKKLFEAVSDTQALLVLSGLPDFYDFLPDDAKQRITKIVRPSALTGIQVANFIKEANKNKDGIGTIKPFSASVAEYIAKITSGNARRISRICYHAYQLAKVENESVTNRIVEKALKDQLSTSTYEDVNKDIVQLIESQGWIYEKDKIIKVEKQEIETSFWLPIKNENQGIVLFCIQNLFNEKEAERLMNKAEKIRISDEKGVSRAVILIAAGFISDNLHKKIVENFDKVIKFNFKHFKEDLNAVLNGHRIKIEERSNTNLMEEILNQVQQLQRKNNSLRHALEDMPSKKDINNLYNLILREENHQKLLPTRNSPFYSILSKIKNLDTIYLSDDPTNIRGKYINKSRGLMFEPKNPLTTLSVIRFYFYHFNEIIIDGNYNRIFPEDRDFEGLLGKFDKLTLMSRERVRDQFIFFESDIETTEKIKRKTNYNLEDFLMNFNKLSFRLYAYLENSNFKNDKFQFNKLSFPINAELNAYFIRIEGVLLTFQNMLKNVLNYYYSSEEFKYIDDIENISSKVIPIINMSYYFMNWVTENLQNFQFRSKNISKRVEMFIEEFDYGIFRKTLDRDSLESLSGFLRHLDERSNNSRNSNIPFYGSRHQISDLVEELFRLPKETHQIIRKEIY